MFVVTLCTNFVEIPFVCGLLTWWNRDLLGRGRSPIRTYCPPLMGREVRLRANIGRPNRLVKTTCGREPPPHTIRRPNRRCGQASGMCTLTNIWQQNESLEVCPTLSWYPRRAVLSKLFFFRHFFRLVPSRPSPVVVLFLVRERNRRERSWYSAPLSAKQFPTREILPSFPRFSLLPPTRTRGETAKSPLNNNFQATSFEL